MQDTGYTDIDDPITNNKSAFGTSFSMQMSNDFGRDSPKNTISGLIIPSVHAVHMGIGAVERSSLNSSEEYTFLHVKHVEVSNDP